MGCGTSDDTPDPEDTATPHYRGSANARASAVDNSGGNVGIGSVLRTRYMLEEIVGQGGSSTVFRASDLHRALPLETASHFVAVKLLQSDFRDDPQALLRLRREFRQTQRLSHPHIVRVFDLDCDGDLWFMTMELLSGHTAKTWMQEPRHPDAALSIIYACCEALEHAHGVGIVHGDLKSTNVMVSDDGSVKLIDFGSATDADSHVNSTPDHAGAATALYASPQVLSGKSPQISDDIFSLACLSYALLSGGRHPFGRRPSFEDGRAKQAPAYVRDIPRELFAVIERGLAVEPEKRPASASEYRSALLKAASTIAATDSGRNIRHESIDIASAQPVKTTHLIALPNMRAAPAARRQGVSMAHVMMITAVALAAVMLFRIGTHRPVITTAQTADAVPKTDDAGAQAGDASAVGPGADTPAVAAAPLYDAGVISFDSANVHASATQTLVAVSVRRLLATRNRGAFMWRVEDGTAQAGTDFQSTRRELVRFGEGESVRTLFIPLIRSQTATPSLHARTFSVVLEPVAGGPELGRIRRTTITIDPTLILSQR